MEKKLNDKFSLFLSLTENVLAGEIKDSENEVYTIFIYYRGKLEVRSMPKFKISIEAYYLAIFEFRKFVELHNFLNSKIDEKNIADYVYTTFEDKDVEEQTINQLIVNAIKISKLREFVAERVASLLAQNTLQHAFLAQHFSDVLIDLFLSYDIKNDLVYDKAENKYLYIINFTSEKGNHRFIDTVSIVRKGDSVFVYSTSSYGMNNPLIEKMTINQFEKRLIEFKKYN